MRSNSAAVSKRYLDVGPDDLSNLFKQGNFTFGGEFTLPEELLDGITIPESFYKVIRIYDKYSLFDVSHTVDLT
jgi:hypothetical protein